MLREKNIDPAILLYSIGTSVETVLDQKCQNIKVEHTTTLFKQAHAFSMLSSEDKDYYMQCAHTILYLLIRMDHRFFHSYEYEYNVLHADWKRALTCRDGRDLIYTGSSGSSLGISYGSVPAAKDRPALFIDYDKQLRPLDISDAWFNTGAMSLDYIRRMLSVTDIISSILGKRWSDAFEDSDQKFQQLYSPILEALKDEIYYQCNRGSDAVQSFVKHFFGTEDYYLVTVYPDVNLARVSAYGLNGKLVDGEAYAEKLLPTKLVDIRNKESTASQSKTTLHLTFDNGWMMNMRLRTTDNKVRKGGPRLEVDFKGSRPYMLSFQEETWR